MFIINPVGRYSDIITTINGFMALTLSTLFLVGHINFYTLLCAFFVFIVLDGFDGFVARKENKIKPRQQFENFGRFLDSFVDVFVYFLVPGLLMYHIHPSVLFSVLWCFVTTVGIIRLSLFNHVGIEAGTKYYTGIPVYYSMFFIIVYSFSSKLLSVTMHNIFMFVLAILYSVGMLSVISVNKVYDPRIFLFIVCLSFQILTLSVYL